MALQYNIKRTISLWVFLFVLSTMGSCILDPDLDNHNEGESAMLRLVIDDVASLSASKSPTLRAGFNEAQVFDLHVLVYDSEGSLTGHGYAVSNTVTVNTHSGTGCNVFAFTNTFNSALFDGNAANVRSLLEGMTTSPDLTSTDAIQTTNGTDSRLLMSGSKSLDIVAGTNPSTSLSVARLSARIRLNLKTGSGVTITGYRFFNVPVRSWLLAHPNTAESTASDEVAGDDAVKASTSGDWISSPLVTVPSTPYDGTFYMYENRRGGRKKVGETTGNNLDWTEKEFYAPDCATYVEIYAHTGSYTATYRLYLGADKYTNYNVKRNFSYTYDVTVNAGTGITISSIQIEPWAEVPGGSATI